MNRAAGDSAEQVTTHSLSVTVHGVAASDDDPLLALQRALVLLRRGGHWTRRDRSIPEELVELGYPLLQVVDVVHEGPDSGESGVSIGTVARRLGVDPSRASRVVARAADEGLVERVASSSDGRRTDLSLTEEGRQVVEGLEGARLGVCRSALEGWSHDDRVAFARLFVRFAEGMPER